MIQYFLVSGYTNIFDIILLIIAFIVADYLIKNSNKELNDKRMKGRIKEKYEGIFKKQIRILNILKIITIVFIFIMSIFTAYDYKKYKSCKENFNNNVKININDTCYSHYTNEIKRQKQIRNKEDILKEHGLLVGE